jgi:AraC family transcriptional regulator of adaptative response/methylated-DNA-[protein]-cysteine methyltransferase
MDPGFARIWLSALRPIWNGFCRKNRVGNPDRAWQAARVNDYERIADVIHYLDEHHTTQPDLDTLAGLLGLSPFHFHRLFTSWAGVTPKDFLQCLTLERVKESLRRGDSVLNAALDAGLSGPGRLHDLCVNLEAASPGEMKSGGACRTVRGGVADSPFGICLVAESPRGLCHLSFVEAGSCEAAWDELQAEWPNAQLRRDDTHARRVARRIFTPPAGRSPRPRIRAFVRGTVFQVRVWRALLRVEPGRLVTYGRLAAAVGNPGGARAVGSAVAQNPLAYLIPCHRVIRETGVIGEYRWGGIRKRALVAWEAARFVNRRGRRGLNGFSSGRRYAGAAGWPMKTEIDLTVSTQHAEEVLRARRPERYAASSF